MIDGTTGVTTVSVASHGSLNTSPESHTHQTTAKTPGAAVSSHGVFVAVPPCNANVTVVVTAHHTPTLNAGDLASGNEEGSAI